MRDASVLLIGGPGRSGTNVLKDVFSMHSEVYAHPFEFRFTIDPDGIVPTYRTLSSCWSPFVAEIALERFESFLRYVSRRTLLDNLCILLEKLVVPFGFKGNIRKYKEWEMEKAFPNFLNLTERLLSDIRLLDYRGCWPGATESFNCNLQAVGYSNTGEHVFTAFQRFFSSLYSQLLAEKGKKYFVEDNTFNILFADDLLALIPKASLVHMVRDPRDVVASYLKQRWCPSSLSDAVLYYRTIMEQWRIIRAELVVDKFLEVRLEDLCSEPHSTLERICEMAGIPFETAMAKYPLDKANSGRWRKEFTIKDQNWLTEQLEVFLSEYAYDA